MLDLGGILKGVIGGAATTYLDIWKQQEEAKAQERILRAQAELERARAEALKTMPVAEEAKPSILPLILIGAVLLLASK